MPIYTKETTIEVVKNDANNGVKEVFLRADVKPEVIAAITMPIIQINLDMTPEQIALINANKNINKIGLLPVSERRTKPEIDQANYIRMFSFRFSKSHIRILNDTKFMSQDVRTALSERELPVYSSQTTVDDVRRDENMGFTTVILNKDVNPDLIRILPQSLETVQISINMSAAQIAAINANSNIKKIEIIGPLEIKRGKTVLATVADFIRKLPARFTKSDIDIFSKDEEYWREDIKNALAAREQPRFVASNLKPVGQFAPSSVASFGAGHVARNQQTTVQSVVPVTASNPLLFPIPRVVTPSAFAINQGRAVSSYAGSQSQPNNSPVTLNIVPGSLVFTVPPPVMGQSQPATPLSQMPFFMQSTLTSYRPPIANVLPPMAFFTPPRFNLPCSQTAAMAGQKNSPRVETTDPEAPATIKQEGYSLEESSGKFVNYTQEDFAPIPRLFSSESTTSASSDIDMQELSEPESVFISYRPNKRS